MTDADRSPTDPDVPLTDLVPLAPAEVAVPVQSAEDADMCRCPDSSPYGGWCLCGHPSAVHDKYGCTAASGGFDD